MLYSILTFTVIAFLKWSSTESSPEDLSSAHAEFYEQLNVTFNLTQFSECVGTNVSNINIWGTGGDFVITPIEGTTFNSIEWSACLEEQDVESIFSFGDSTYTDGLEAANHLLDARNHINRDIFEWSGYRHHHQNDFYTEQLNFTLNLSQFSECLGTKIANINIWEGTEGNYVLTPGNTGNFDLILWADCVDEQGVGDVLSVSDGTYVDDLVDANDQVKGDIFQWSGFRSHTLNQIVVNAAHTNK
ncbi:uncharacterized protein RJT21DRAFT_56637 [Scheffersomyces amazonensis]|uniref:uncharacterized protein n=1 Tax=Scheffersomyces amazonensis TaxID=1078765 RepID=UPI00315CC7C5